MLFDLTFLTVQGDVKPEYVLGLFKCLLSKKRKSHPLTDADQTLNNSDVE